MEQLQKSISQTAAVSEDRVILSLFKRLLLFTVMLMGLNFCGAAAAQSITFSQTLNAGVTYPSSSGVFQAWGNFRAQLTGSYNSISVSGSRDTVGQTCFDATVATQIANALNTGATLSVTCGGVAWKVGGCGQGPELRVGGAGICTCNTGGYSIRPQIGVNQNWGGINGATCNGLTQTMTVTVNYTVAIINCPTGSIATGSGFAPSGSGAFRNSIFWFDWQCGANTNFGSTNIVKKDWILSDGTIVYGKLENITNVISPNDTGTLPTAPINSRYGGVNPIGIRTQAAGSARSFRLSLFAEKNGAPISLAYVLADAEATNSGENIVATTGGTSFSLVETSNAATLAGLGTTAITKSSPASHAIVSTAGNMVVLNITLGSASSNQAVAIGARLTFLPIEVNKTSAVFDPTNAKLKAIPGNDVIYTINVTNSGDTFADSGSLFLFDKLPSDVHFYNGDIDGAGPATGNIIFTENGSGLSFNPATDLAFSNASAPPTDIAQCTYSPVIGYDPAVRYICLRPTGSFNNGDPDPSFDVKFRASIR